MARALIVGCGCRGRELGSALAAEGWAVRGTSREEAGAEAIAAAGIEPALADPALPGTVLDLVGDVAVVFWLLGSARGGEEELAAIHGQKLERLLERFVDTPVRGFVYETVGSVGAQHLRSGRAAVEAAASTWRIPAEVIAVPREHPDWLEAALGAAHSLAERPAAPYS